MIDLGQCLLIGALAKTHGIKGQLVLRLNNIDFKNIRKMETVFFMIEGLPVPFFVSAWQDKPPHEIILKIDDIDNPEDAAKHVGTQIYLHKSNLDENRQPLDDLHELFGYDVIDEKHGHLGTLDDFYDTPSNPLLRILKDRKELLLPFQDEFIAGLDHDAKTLHVNIPDGLLDL